MMCLSKTLMLGFLAGLILAMAACGDGASSNGVQVELVSTKPDPPVAAVVEVTLQITDRAGQPIDDQITQVNQLTTMAGMGGMHDSQGVFTSRGNGLWVGQVDFTPSSGTWEVQVTVSLKEGRVIEKNFILVAAFDEGR